MGRSLVVYLRDRVVTVKIRWFLPLLLVFHPFAHRGSVTSFVACLRSASPQITSAACSAIVSLGGVVIPTLSVCGESRSRVCKGRAMVQAAGSLAWVPKSVHGLKQPGAAPAEARVACTSLDWPGPPEWPEFPE